MQFAELMSKWMNGETLNGNERDFLRQKFNTIDENDQLVSSWQQVNKKIKSEYLDLPVDLIYSKVLVQNETSITIKIPQNFNHLMIFSSGRVDAPNTDPPYSLRARFNGSSTDYAYQFIRAINTTLSGAKNTDTAADIGLFLAGTSSDGDISNISFIPNYRGSFNKTVLSLMGYGERAVFQASVWNNTSPITSTEIFAATSLVTGSSISIVGIK